MAAARASSVFRASRASPHSRARGAVATGALLGGLTLDVTAFFWMLHDGSMFASATGGAF